MSADEPVVVETLTEEEVRSMSSLFYRKLFRKLKIIYVSKLEFENWQFVNYTVIISRRYLQCQLLNQKVGIVIFYLQPQRKKLFYIRQIKTPFHNTQYNSI